VLVVAQFRRAITITGWGCTIWASVWFRGRESLAEAEARPVSVTMPTEAGPDWPIPMWPGPLTLQECLPDGRTVVCGGEYSENGLGMVEQDWNNTRDEPVDEFSRADDPGSEPGAVNKYR
jgi:hypothetical protein